MICKYDEVFTTNEMLEETFRCKNCQLDCPNKGKSINDGTKIVTVYDYNDYIDILKRLRDPEPYDHINLTDRAKEALDKAIELMNKELERIGNRIS
jgi:hypothetical protein